MEGFIKYPKIYALGKEENQDIFSDPDDEIIVPEKMDGANFRFMIKGGNVIFGSRAQQLTDNEGEDTNMSKAFIRCAEYIRTVLKKSPVDLINLEGHIFFGECMTKHTLEYDWGKIPPFLGFDMYDIKNNKFLEWDVMGLTYESIGLPIVPLIKAVKAKDITEMSDKDVPISAYAPKSNPSQQAEGVVFKNYKKQIYAKYVRAKFQEENKKSFGISPKYAHDDTSKLVAKYCTNARIEKEIFKLVDEGHRLDKPMMKYLPRNVFTDIIEEEWKNILLNGGDMVISTKKFRKLVSKRCFAVLNQVITNNQIIAKD